MIKIVSINKSSEGLILKSTIRYSWAFKIGSNSHLVEFLEGSMGKKNLYIDSVEKSSVRSFLAKFSEKFLLENILFEIKADEVDYDIYLLEQGVKFKNLLSKNEIKNENHPEEKKTRNHSNNNAFDNGFGSEWDFVNSNNNNKRNNNTNNNNKNFGHKRVEDTIDFLDMESGPTKKVNNNNNLNTFENFNFGKKNDVDIFNKKNNFKNPIKKNSYVDDFENLKNEKTGFDNEFDNFENNPFAEKKTKDKGRHDPWGKRNNDNFTNFDFNDQKEKTEKKYKIFDEKNKKKKQIPNDIFEDSENNFEKATLVHNENKKEFKMTLDSEKEEKIEDAFYTEADFDSELTKKLEINKNKRFNYDMDPEESYKKIKKGFKNLFKKTSKLVDRFENKCSNLVYGNTGEKDIEDHIQHDDKKEVNDLGKDIQNFYGGNDIEDTVGIQFKKNRNKSNNPFEDNEQLKNLRSETPFLDEFVGEENLNTPDFGGFDKKNVFRINNNTNKNKFDNKNQFAKGFSSGFENNKNSFGNSNGFRGNKNEFFSDKTNSQKMKKKNVYNNFKSSNQNKNEDNYLEKVLSSGFLNINEFENTNTNSTPFD